MADLGNIGVDGRRYGGTITDGFLSLGYPVNIDQIQPVCNGPISCLSIYDTPSTLGLKLIGHDRPQGYITTREDGVNAPLQVEVRKYGRFAGDLGVSPQPFEIRGRKDLFGYEFAVRLYGTKRTEVWGPYTLPESPSFTLTGDLPDGQEGVPYSGALTASNAVELVEWSLSGDLPTGLSFDLGSLTGTPTAAGTYSFYIGARDPYDGCLRWKDFTVVIAPA